MQLTKHIGCLLALVFATASAFANDTWFTAEIGDSLVSPWSGSLSALTIGDGVIKLNNWNDANELVYTPKDYKTLPGDEATIRTKVKFTPMDMADFETQKEMSLEGAKGGLTIVEDSDAAQPTTKFYGIVGGTDGGVWTELEGDTSVALDGQVEVEVKIWENNGKHISYKITPVDSQNEAFFLKLNGKSDLTASFTGDTISSVSYKGVCEIASLEGDAQDELWTLTSKVIADAAVTLTIDGVNVPLVDGNKFKAQKGSAVLTYTLPQTSTVRFYDASGLGVLTKPSVARNIEGEAELNFTAEFEDVTATEPVAQNGSSYYNSIAAAVGGVGNTVNVLKDANETVEIGKALSLTANENVAISGTFTWMTGGELTIESGAYDCDFVGFTAGKLILKGGLYTQSAKDVQPFCAAKYFASEIEGNYNSAVAIGTDIESSGDMPAISVASSVETEATLAGKTTSEYLQEETAGSGSIKRWQSYALGLGTNPEKTPKFAVTNDNDVSNISLTKNFEVLKSAGVSVTYQVGEGAASTEEPKIAISDLNYGATKKVVKVLTDGKVAASTTIGANKVKAPAVANTRTLFTVPWADSATGTGVTVANLFKTAALKGGETIELYNQEADAYVKWTFNDGAWANTTDDIAGNAGLTDDLKALAATETTVTKGQALWFTGSADAVQFGVDSVAESKTPVAAAKWGFVANPISAESKSLAEIIAPSSVPSAQVQLTDKETGKTVIYFNNGTSWGYNEVVNRKRQFKAVDNLMIAPGQEFWFDNKGASEAKLAW